jgi:transcriptional regulator with XRE-family HTH domain
MNIEMRKRRQAAGLTLEELAKREGLDGRIGEAHALSQFFQCQPGRLPSFSHFNIHSFAS